MTWHALLQNPVVLGALGGLGGAAKTDLEAFQRWQSFHDAAVYDWKLAAFRWVKGAITGAITGAGAWGVLGLTA